MNSNNKNNQRLSVSSKLYLLMGFGLLLCSCGQEKNEIVSPVTESSVFSYIPPVYTEIPLGELRPQGSLHAHLQNLADNSTGHKDEIHEKMRNHNGWLELKGDNLEETPYWLDGAVPLAYELDDERLLAKVLKYINWSLNNQRPSRYFGAITEWERETGKQIDIANILESGTAGGTGAAVMVFMDGKLENGINLALENLGMEEFVKEADLVITGEGKIDEQTLCGKTISGIANMGKKHWVPVIAIAGKICEILRVCMVWG